MTHAPPSPLSAGDFHPFMARDVPWLLAQQAEQRGDAVFLVWESLGNEDRTWTYLDFADAVEAWAGNLSAQGVQAGDRILVHLDNCPEFLFVWFASARLGAVAVTTNTRSAIDEVQFFAADCQPRIAVTQPSYYNLVRKAIGDETPIFVREADPGGGAAATVHDGRALGDLSLSGTLAPTRIADPLAPISVQYTSGTTSRPKGVVWTHANALWGAKVNSAHARLTAADVTPVFLPLFHTNAIAYSTLATLWSGGTIILQPRFSASRFWEIALKHGCTWANMIGFTIQTLVGRPAPPDHKFRMWACASDVAVIRELWGIKTIGWWGMTETISHGSVADLDWLNPEMSMGRPTPEYELRIVDGEGVSVDFGQTGKLQLKGVRGLSVFLEYLNNPQATAAAFTQDGWLDTGDLVTLGASGDLYFAEREKDMLKIGGENVAASEIERAIRSVQGVADVAVVGRPDPLLDEVAVAFVVLAPGASTTARQIVERCTDLLADFKAPRDVRFLSALPKGTLDKVLKKDLRALARVD